MRSMPFIIPTLLLASVLLTAGQGRAEEPRLNAVEKQIEELRNENKTLKERLDEVETVNEETRQSVSSFANMVDVSGYADVEYVATGQPGQNNKFRIHHLSLFFSKNIQKQWRFFSEVEYEDAPRMEAATATDTVNKAQGVIFVEQMYLQYHPRFDWDVRAGRFLTPAGYWGIYHYPPYVPTQSYPLYFKVMFPEVSDGLQLRKSVPLGEMNIDANVYAANGAGNSGNGDRNNNKGFGGRLNFDIISGLSAGASYYREKDNFDSLNSAYGAHLVLTHKAVRVLSEYVKRRNKPRTMPSFNDLSWYGQVSYDIGNWTLAGRYDWYDASDKVSKNCRYRSTGAINYHIAHNIVGKAEFSSNNFEDPALKDYNEMIFSVVAAIGDL